MSNHKWGAFARSGDRETRSECQRRGCGCIKIFRTDRQAQYLWPSGAVMNFAGNCGVDPGAPTPEDPS